MQQLCNSCSSLARLVLCFIACFILLVIAPLAAMPPTPPWICHCRLSSLPCARSGLAYSWTRIYIGDNEQEQQRVAVGPGNAQFMYIRQVSLRRAAAAAAANAAAIGQCTD